MIAMAEVKGVLPTRSPTITKHDDEHGHHGHRSRTGGVRETWHVRHPKPHREESRARRVILAEFDKPDATHPRGREGA